MRRAPRACQASRVDRTRRSLRAGNRPCGKRRRVSSLLAFELEAHTSPTLFWAWGAATLLLATGLGFLAGTSYANRSADRGFRRRSKALSSLYALALDSLDKAQHLSGLLESFPGASVDCRRGRPARFEARLARGDGRPPRSPNSARRRPNRSRPSSSRSLRRSGSNGSGRRSIRRRICPIGRCSTRTCGRCSKPGSQTALSNGLLLVKIDRREQLRARFGHHRARTNSSRGWRP